MLLQSGSLPREESLLERGARRTAELIAPPQKSPSEALRDMRLPQSAIDILSCPLQDLGFDIRDKTVQPRWSSSEHTFTVIGNQGLEQILLHIEGWILDNPTDKKYNALTALPFAFEEGTSLLMLSEGLDVIPARAYRNMIAERWPQKHGVQATFVPWIDILTLKKSSPRPDHAHVLLRDILELDELSRPVPGAPSASDMLPEEKQELTRIIGRTHRMSNVLQSDERIELQQIIAELSEFAQGTERDRRVLMDMAGLGGLASGLDLSGPPRTAAGTLVLGVERHGFLGDRPHFHALGALLSYMLTLGDLPRDDATFIARLVVECSLVKDPDYIRKLREEYDLADSVVREAAPDTTARPSERDYTDRKYLSHLREMLVTRHSMEDLRLLCFELSVVIPDLDYDNLVGHGKATKALALLEYLEDRKRIADLVEVGRRLRPDIPW
jgi:hypothetical protein